MGKRQALQIAAMIAIPAAFITVPHYLFYYIVFVWKSSSLLFIDLFFGLVGLCVAVLAVRALFPSQGPVDKMDTAIANGEFVPFFQPIINLATSEISGFEMLARWIRPDGEIVSPDRFIPLAENYGRTDAILFALLHSAGRNIGHELRNNPDLKLTFNITPDQFLDPGFLSRLLDVLKRADLPASGLIAEITERRQTGDLERASQTIAQYKKHGIGVAIDDVGTGHNGLSSIHRLDVCTLKLDKIFIDGICENERSRQMVELLANLARQYQMNIVAEGIETPEQARAALDMGIHEGQGFYFACPLPASELLDLLDEQRKPLTQNNNPQHRHPQTPEHIKIAS